MLRYLVQLSLDRQEKLVELQAAQKMLLFINTHTKWKSSDHRIYQWNLNRGISETCVTMTHFLYISLNKVQYLPINEWTVLIILSQKAYHNVLQIKYTHSTIVSHLINEQWWQSCLSYVTKINYTISKVKSLEYKQMNEWCCRWQWFIWS